MKPSTINIAVVTGVFVISVLALWLRVTLIHASDLWYDEAFTGITIRSSWLEMIGIIINDKVHPPLYYLMLKVWTLLLGGSGVGVLRGFSVLWGVLLLPIIAVGIQKSHMLLDSQKPVFTLGTTLFFAINPFFVSYSVEARSYSLLTFLYAVFVFLCLKRFGEKQEKYTALVVVTGVLLSLTHFIGTLSILTFIVLVVCERQWIIDRLKSYAIAVTALFWLFSNSILKVFGLVYNFPGWVPRIRIADVPEFFSAILLGVDRQARGVPPVNTTVLGDVTFWFGMTMLVFFLILLAKYLMFCVDLEQRRGVTVFILLSILPLAVVVLLSRVSIHLFVERYLIGFAFTILFLLLYVLIKKSSQVYVTFILLYVCVVLLVRAPVARVEYNSIIPLLPNTQSLYVTDPGDFVVLKYYRGELPTRLIVSEKGSQFSSFSVISPRELVIEQEIEPLGFVLEKQGEQFADVHNYRKILEQGEFRLYQKP